MSAEHWYLLPMGFGIAVLAMSSGISAGNFWAPVYLLWARFEPPLAFWMTLATMLCGYGSGVTRNLRQGTLDRRIILQYLPFTVAGALVGGSLAPALNISWLLLLFGLFVFGYGLRMLVRMMPSQSPGPHLREGQRQRWKPCIQEYGVGLVGGLLLGLIAIGLGELMLPRLLAERKSLSPAEIVGSTVLVIFVASLAAALVRLNGPLVATLSEQGATLLRALLFAGPGVILGGQLGPRMARHLDSRALRWYVAVILVLVGILVLVRFLALVAFSR